MIYRGQFTTKDDKLITVEIWTDSKTEDYDEATIVEIGSNGLYFGGDPVHIMRNVNDSFDHIIIHQCEVQLKTDTYIGDDLINMSSNNVLVRVWEGTSGVTDNILFEGYADPLVFSQPYVTRLDEFTITASDRLGQLQYFNYKDIYTKQDYNAYVTNAKFATMQGILEECMTAIGNHGNVYFDKSIGLIGSYPNPEWPFLWLMYMLEVNEMVYLGDSIDDVMNLSDTLESVLKYLNLHIMYIGNDVYIFNWHTIRQRGGSWCILDAGMQHYDIPISGSLINFSTALHAGADANLTMDNIYTQVSVKTNIEDIDSVVNSPLDRDSLETFYFNQKYMTEIISDGEGDRAITAFKNMVDGNDTDYDAAKMVDWYCQHKYNKNWKTYVLDRTDNIRKELNTYATYNPNGYYINQQLLWQTIQQNPCSAGIFQFGHIEQQVGQIKDNAPVHKLEMTPYLCFSLNGNHNHTQENHLPNETQLTNASPICEFKSPLNGGQFSPTSEGITNYLVFSGKILLQKAQKETAAYNTFKNSQHQGYYKYMCVPSKDNGDGRYYTRKWYGQLMETSEPYVINTPSFHPPRYETVDETGGNWDFPYDNENPPSSQGQYIQWYVAKNNWSDGGDIDYQYNYTTAGNNNDMYYKLPLLECELIIGNKRLVETSWGRTQGQPNTVKPTYEWVTLGEEPYANIKKPDGGIERVRLTTFSLGIDPKIEDYIIGKEHELSNNVEYTMNIDANGTAIPIKESDKLSGDVTFRIIGPITTIWSDVQSHSHSWWLLWAHHYTTWSNDLRYVLSECETMFVKDFECKLYSSLGSDQDTSGKEVVYMSVEDDRIEKKDDIDFKICTQPTLETFLENSVEYKQCSNAVIDSREDDRNAVQKLYSRATTTADIPEKLYVDQYYNEYHQGKLLLEGTFHIHEKTDWLNQYQLPSINNKKFYIQKIDHSLKQNEADVTFKEI